MIPWGASVSVHWNRGTPREHRLVLWLPLFLLWLVLLPLLLVLFPLVVLACLMVRVNALRLYWTAWQIVSSLRRTLVDVKCGNCWVRVSLA